MKEVLREKKRGCKKVFVFVFGRIDLEVVLEV